MFYRTERKIKPQPETNSSEGLEFENNGAHPCPRSLIPSDLPRPPLAPAVRRHIFRPSPWLGTKHDGYPLLPFQDYLKDRRTSTCSELLDVQEDAALYQSQLTFGLLEAVMEVKLSESMMVASSGGGNISIDENLPDLLADWRCRIMRLGRSEECRKWFDRVEEALRFAHRFLLMELTTPHSRPFRLANIPWESHCAILLTCASIGEVLVSSRRVFPPEFPRQDFSWSFIDGFANLNALAMLKNGWCPFVVRIVGESGICGLSYASTRHPFVREGSNGHENCSERACILNNIDTSTYHNKHTTSCCGCTYLKPPLESILEYLRTGEIPVVRYDPTVCRLLASSASSTTGYVAISHVWADGLGSTTEVGLPLCQIELLTSKVEETGVGNVFWMDSLCVPAEPELRKKAIRLMAKTYREASATLVLDSGIRHCSASAPLEEKLLAVLSCGWMQRLWTLQEALLALRLTFAFADRLENINSLIPVGEDLLDCLLTRLCAEIFRMTKHQRSVDSTTFGIGDLSCSLQWRSTSKSDDETLAIAGLVNVDVKELINLPPHERMRTFLVRVRNLPPDIIFMSAPKLKEPGFRWAPQMLMQRGGSPMAVSGYKAICTPAGLLAEYTALYFEVTEAHINASWFLSNVTKGTFYQATVVVSDDLAETYSCDTLLMMELPGPSNLVVCAAVLVTGADKEEQGDRMICQYQRRLFLIEIPEFKLRRENPTNVVVARSGRMLTRVT